MPIECKRIELNSLNKYAIKEFTELASTDSCTSTLEFAYQIRGLNDMHYSTYHKTILEKG